jgi:hypothetical protein
MIKNLTTKKLELILTVLSTLILIGLQQNGVVIATVIVMIYLRRSENRNELQRSVGLIRPKKIFPLITVSLVMGVAIELIFEILLNPIIEKWTHSKIDLSQIDLSTLSKYLMWLIITFVLGGLFEEILFRGFLLTRISQFLKGNKSSDVIALFLTSIVFGLCHYYQGWAGIISTGLIGLILGSIFLVFNKNLWYSILTHGFVNLTSITMLYLGYYEKIAHLQF